jgi:hypothetical protein
VAFLFQQLIFTGLISQVNFQEPTLQYPNFQKPISRAKSLFKIQKTYPKNQGANNDRAENQRPGGGMCGEAGARPQLF